MIIFLDAFVVQRRKSRSSNCLPCSLETAMHWTTIGHIICLKLGKDYKLNAPLDLKMFPGGKELVWSLCGGMCERTRLKMRQPHSSLSQQRLTTPAVRRVISMSPYLQQIKARISKLHGRMIMRRVSELVEVVESRGGEWGSKRRHVMYRLLNQSIHTQLLIAAKNCS